MCAPPSLTLPPPLPAPQPGFGLTVENACSQRVQGATLEDDVHILLNAEMFAEGQAYVALSRVRRLSQVHFWCGPHALRRTSHRATRRPAEKPCHSRTAGAST